MRPLELTLHGFRSYREPATFEWRGRGLVGIVGPIGAGKSTILDGVAFALFGKTPTFERDTKALIHQLAETCHVELRFEVEGQVWRAVRALRRKGASGHQLERLAADEPEAETLEHVTGERPVRARVEELLGMDFDAFCRSVLLAQNRFSEFLKATPTERNEVLKGVFGYERFDAAHELAKRRVAVADAVLAELDRASEQVSHAREELDAAREALEAAAVVADRLRGARPRVEALSREINAAEELGAGAQRRLSALDAVVRSLPQQERLDADLAMAGRMDDAIAAAAGKAEQAEQARREAEATFAAVAERAGDRSAFVALVQQLDHCAEAARRASDRKDHLKDLATQARTQAAEAAAAAEKAARGRTAATQALAAASTAVTESETSLHDARQADMARTLRTHLVAGEPCPVCDQPVATLPTAGRAPKVAAAEKALHRARSIEAAAREKGERAAEDAAKAQERTTSLDEQATRARQDSVEATEGARAAEAELAAVQSQLVDRLGEGDPHALLAEREAELKQADAARIRAGEAAAEAREASERIRAEGAAARDGLTRLATELASVWGMLGEPREIGVTPAELRSAFVDAGERLIERHESESAALAEAREAREAAAGGLVALLGELALPAGTDFAEALAGAAAAHAAAQQRVAGLQAAIEAAAELAARTEAARRGRDLAKRLASDLQPSRFLTFLLEEERAALAELGSVHFEELTNGAYRFTDDDRFDVVDMNAAATRRRADSLSGGETFLASLALALALAEMVARSGGRLDAFFLDEGFGSLDPEHLERAMDGVGKLVAGDGHRLVVLVSHVDQMRQMLEDLVVLDKDPLTGDTIIISGARPA